MALCEKGTFTIVNDLIIVSVLGALVAINLAILNCN